MEYYLTTYTKDYQWPVAYSPSKSEKTAENKSKLVAEQIKREPCAVYKSQPLQEPQIDPAQCGAPPAGPESQFGQPLTYLRKLYLKYPYLYQILKLTPPEELAKTVYADKYVSTYNADYKVEGFKPLKGWLTSDHPSVPDETQKAGLDGKEDEVHSPNPQGLCEVSPQFAVEQGKAEGNRDGKGSCGCVGNAQAHMKTRSVQKIARKPATISKIPRPPPMSNKKREDKRAPEYTGGSHPPRLGKWKTEYRDTISKMGGVIIHKKLLSRPAELKE